VGVNRVLLRLGVYERPPRAIEKLIIVVLVGEHLGRRVLGEHGLGVTFGNFC